MVCSCLDGCVCESFQCLLPVNTVIIVKLLFHFDGMRFQSLRSPRVIYKPLSFLPESLDELAAMVLEMFSPIENKGVPVASFPEPPYSENELQVKKLTN